MHRRRHRGFGPRGLGSRWYSHDNVLQRLEEYRRELEQELADVSDLIRRLRAGEQPGAQPQATTI